MIGAPAVSLVVVSPGDATHLAARLERLSRQYAAGAAELVVVHAGEGAGVDGLAGRYPDVGFVTCPAGTPAGALRAAGMRAARGDIVALMEDDAEVADRLSHLVSCYRRDPA